MLVPFGLAAVVATAGCGGASRPHAKAASTASVAANPCHVDSARARRTLPGLHADVAAIRRARTHAATSGATDRFIDDLEHAGLSLQTENRLIDFAISASLGKCPDCVQALEALRPIPSLQSHRCR